MSCRPLKLYKCISFTLSFYSAHWLCGIRKNCNCNSKYRPCGCEPCVVWMNNAYRNKKPSPSPKHVLKIIQTSRFVVLYCGILPFTHILQCYFTGTGAIVWLPQCQWSNSEGPPNHMHPPRTTDINCHWSNRVYRYFMNSLKPTILGNDSPSEAQHNRVQILWDSWDVYISIVLVQDFSNSIANALELLQPCTKHAKPSTFTCMGRSYSQNTLEYTLKAKLKKLLVSRLEYVGWYRSPDHQQPWNSPCRINMLLSSPLIPITFPILVLPDD